MRAPAVNVLVIGAGMYVCGRGTSSFGTVLPTLTQAKAQGLVDNIFVASTSKNSIDTLKGLLSDLNEVMGLETTVVGYPQQDQDPYAYQKALKELPKPACAIIVTPDHTHSSIAADVIRAGVHPLVVKPLTPTLEEANQLVEMAEANDIHGAVEFHKRFDESNLLLRKQVTDGVLGELRHISVEYSQRRQVRDLFSSWIQHTNIFQYLGVHYVDIIYFTTNAQPVRVLATGQPSFPSGEGLHNYDSIQALIEWEGGPQGERFTSTIATNWIDPNTTSAMSDQKITVVGTSGRLQADQKNRGLQLVTDDGGNEEINPYFTQIYKDGYGSVGVHGYGPRSIYQFLTDVQDISQGTVNPSTLVSQRPSFRDALVSTAVVEAVNISLARGSEWVGIDELRDTIGEISAKKGSDN